jgi:Zn-dependent protease with chaperone function
MLAVILGCWTVASGAITPVAQHLAEEFAQANAAVSEESIVQVASLARDAGVLVLGLLLFGYASRRFERQADTYAVQLLSRGEGATAATRPAVEAMIGALGSVALLNHVPPARPSWRHGSIAWRQDYLRAITGERLDAMPIDAFAAVLRWGALAVVAAGALLGIFPF